MTDTITEDPKPPVCDCCGYRLGFQWSDTHGIGVCITCGLPYRIYHYEREGATNRRIDRPPSVVLTATGLEIAKRYWTETKRRVFPAEFDMGISRDGNRSYSGASIDDCEAFHAWYRAHESEFPPEADAPPATAADGATP